MPVSITHCTNGVIKQKPRSFLNLNILWKYVPRHSPPLKKIKHYHSTPPPPLVKLIISNNDLDTDNDLEFVYAVDHV